jgi:hypothetical protein
MEDSILKKEGFVIYTCPSKTVKYITRRGETNCCNGDIVDNECNGNNVCSLSPTNSLGIQSCQTYASNVANEAAAANCIIDMPYYFASTNGSLRGCSAAPATADGTASSDPTKLQCILYPTDALDKVKLDSCYNYKANTDKVNAANEKCAAASATSNAPSILGSIGSSIASATSNAPSILGSMGSSIASVNSLVSSPVNPTGYVIYGSGISGNLPVAKILDVPGASGAIYGKIYMAQDGPKVRSVLIDPEYTKILNSLDFTMDISKMTETQFNINSNYPDFKYTTDYNIKKADGSGILSSSVSSAVSAPVNPTGYVMSGDDIVGQIPVQQVIIGVAPKDPNITIFFSQNGSSIAAAISATENKMNIVDSKSIPGKLSDYSFTDITSFLKTALAEKFGRAPLRTYKVSKV